MQEKIVILDFGSQYTQLIGRRVREQNVYCEIHPYNDFPQIDDSVKGVILSGSPHSVREDEAPAPDLSSIRGKVPLLGVCYGAQWLAKNNGGVVEASKTREYGRANLSFIHDSHALLKDIPQGSQVWMSHGDTILDLPQNAELICSTTDVKVAGFSFNGEKTYGIQFHPEVYHSVDGKILLKNFLIDVCSCACDWTPASFVEDTVAQLQSILGNDRVVMGLSGGVDSSVAAQLLHLAIGKNLYCIFVDNGLLRKNEFEQVLEGYKDMGLNIKGVDAKQSFYHDLKGVTDPEKKRKIIGNKFIEVFDDEAGKIKDVKPLG